MSKIKQPIDAHTVTSDQAASGRRIVTRWGYAYEIIETAKGRMNYVAWLRSESLRLASKGETPRIVCRQVPSVREDRRHRYALEV